MIICVKCCHVCGKQFTADLLRKDQEPPFYCPAHITQAPWYRRIARAVYWKHVAHNLQER